MGVGGEELGGPGDKKDAGKKPGRGAARRPPGQNRDAAETRGRGGSKAGVAGGAARGKTLRGADAPGARPYQAGIPDGGVAGEGTQGTQGTAGTMGMGGMEDEEGVKCQLRYWELTN